MAKSVKLEADTTILLHKAKGYLMNKHPDIRITDDYTIKKALEGFKNEF